ncbi:MAG: dihydropteroate synthase [Candidatus Aminicenantes bacterium]|nr:dihydropteroate synthase [Candidatus Aminicenantes bacterium]
MKLVLRKRFVELKSPVIMGILNVTPDSFSDGGRYLKINDALKHIAKMVRDGADIIDIGGESTRPRAKLVTTEEEIDRIVPIIEKVKKEFEILVSIDTYKDRLAKVAVQEADVDMVNDISGLRFSENMASTIASLDVPVVVMHMQGSPENMQKNPYYSDVVREIKQYFSERIEYAMSKGIRKDKLIIDPGIGFGKRFEDNIEIIKHLNEFNDFECPLLIGLSRKSFLGTITGEKIPRKREIETVAAHIISILNGASIVRVHNVKNMVKVIKILQHLVEVS